LSDILDSSSSQKKFQTFLLLLKYHKAGIKRHIITFSFNHSNLSTFLETEASTNTLTVSWKLAAESQESVCNEILVSHNNNLVPIACFHHFSDITSFSFLNLIISTISQGKKEESHALVIFTLENICLTIKLRCLEFTV
jgi:hypothetical protein